MATPPENPDSTSNFKIEDGNVADNNPHPLISGTSQATASSSVPVTSGFDNPNTLEGTIIVQHAASSQHSSNASHFVVSEAGASGPRRGSSPNILPHGHTIPPSLDWGTSNGEGTGDINSNDQTVYKLDKDELHTDSDPDFRHSRGSFAALPPSGAMPSFAHTTDSVANNADGTNTSINRPTTSGVSEEIYNDSSTRKSKQYVLSDGSVVSGKGLGRGRPGVKRGPRTTKDKSHEGIPLAAPDTSTGGLEQPSKKRKSADGNTMNARSTTADSATTQSRESSEEYNPTGHTRSGRQTQKPVNLTNENTASASPSKPSRAGFNHTPTPSASAKTHPKIKRRIYRGREQFALCEHCLRGHGPPGNVIVFCDACNKCWHQRCHDPQISKQTVSDAKAEWYCTECDRILHGKKAKKINTKTKVAPVPPVVPPTPVYAGTRVGGRFLLPDQKLAYLHTLSKENLISLLMHASDLAPDLPIFQTLVTPAQPSTVPQAQFTSTYVTPVTDTPTSRDADGGDAVDEGYDGYYDEHAALYPKPGNGIRLPPEREDLHMLLEGKDSKTFSHWVRGMPGNDYSGSGNVMNRC
ncbi:hypothetical protein PV08_11443 [Exophiala spinifera]|uniref:PHD-type domain-containing protein n=1 Tax=Exophiala spinifera TaxID=91928 RepID=A0A0D2BGN6_9EURO|nr:uncharacterized protein PV08_11443 [Exophiala spinifera]KIW10479.1 hypothetical protein PV08_11443 [Exophiala spinifera]